MNEALPKLQQTTLEDLLNVISLQASEPGVMHLETQDGQMIDLFGLRHCRVNPSPAPELKKAKQTNDTYSPTIWSWSDSVSLTSSLANKLKERLGTDGSMIYTQKWKEKVTPAGLVLSAHTASTPRTKGRDSTGQPSGWRTPQAHNASQGPKSEAFYLECVKTGKSAITLTDEARHAEVSGWPTPSTRDQKGGYVGGRIRNGKISTDTLDVTAQIAGWPTPMANNANKDCNRYRENHQNGIGAIASIAGWATPNTMDTLPIRSDESLARAKQKAGCSNLKDQVPITGWATPNTMDTLPARSDQAMYNQARNGARKNRSFPGNLREQVDERMQKCYQDAKNDARKGITQSSGYTAGITSTGQLNPALSRWLMGLPIEWCEAAIIANRELLHD